MEKSTLPASPSKMCAVISTYLSRRILIFFHGVFSLLICF
jgi:hypothetical protein